MAMPGRLDDYNLTRLNGFDVGEASGHKLQRLWRRLDFARRITIAIFRPVMFC